MLFVLLLRQLQTDISIYVWTIAVSDVEKYKLKLTLIFCYAVSSRTLAIIALHKLRSFLNNDCLFTVPNAPVFNHSFI